MSKALKTKSGQYFVILLATVIILISSLCWSRLISQSYQQQDVAVVENASFRGKAKQSGQNIKGKYMFITGVMTAIVKYLPFQGNDN